MIENRVSKMNSYFDEQIAACVQQGKALAADDRADEAAFEKVRANVLDIFRTILSVAVKMGKGDPEKVKEFFILKRRRSPRTGSLPTGMPNITATRSKCRSRRSRST